MKCFLAALFLLFIGTAGYSVVMFTGPHMKVQPHIRTFQRSMPLPPEGIVPVERIRSVVPSQEEAAGLKNPLPDSEENRNRGKVYYSYYCVFCHGGNGQGDGPVGYSYMPAPTDLHDQRVLRLSDGALMVKMLTGIGHDPVLRRVVLPEHRWYLVTYIRALGKGPLKPTENQGRQVLGKEPGVIK